MRYSWRNIAEFSLERKNLRTQFVYKKNNIIFFSNIFSENSSQILETRVISKYGKLDNINKAFALRAVYIRQETHTQNM
jgi:hypothetical protein